MSDLKTPHIPIAKIDVDPSPNVRTHIDEEKLKGLTASIEAVGVLQPLVVRAKENGRFELIAGERRYWAAKAAGLEDVPASFGKGNAHLNRRDRPPARQRDGRGEQGLPPHARRRAATRAGNGARSMTTFWRRVAAEPHRRGSRSLCEESGLRHAFLRGGYPLDTVTP